MKWIAWLELQTKIAIANDPSLLDAEAVGVAIFRARYGEERWERRLSRTRKSEFSIILMQERRRKLPDKPNRPTV